MATAHDTDERLRHRLDSNQEQRERLCSALLSLDARFSRIVPRRPKGGPDKGRDIEAVFEGRRLAFGAVSFVNTANDSTSQKSRIKRKFRADLTSALNHKPDLDAFIFFTNIDLTPAEIEELTNNVSVNGKLIVEIFYRERMRMALDSPAGFGFRYQYLDIKMSEDEQVAFFAEFGDQLQNLIARKFTDLDRSLERIEFFADKTSPLNWLQAVITLDQEYELSALVPFCVLFQFRRRGSGSSGPQFCIAGEDTCIPSHTDGRLGLRLYVGTEQHAMYDLKDPFRTSVVNQIALGGELLPGPPIPTIGSLDQYEINIFISETLAARISSIDLVANVYAAGRIQKEDIYIEPVDGPPWWPTNSAWPDLGPTAKNVSWVELSRATGLPYPEYLPNVPWLIDFYRRPPTRSQL